jgi:uncharacterized damage-inducible protein DinB
MAVTWRTTRPGADEYGPHYTGYIEESASGDLLEMLERQLTGTALLLDGVPAGRADHRYAPDKWSVKEVIGHLADSERVFAYRALRFARQDASPLASFDENAWVPGGGFDARSLADIAAEFAAVRRASLALFRSFDDEAAMRRGTASGRIMSVRALVAVIAGHERHHVRILRERYGVG